MLPNFADIKKVKPKIRNTVSGYIRKCQHVLLPKNNPYYNIPSLIYFICIAYYNQREYFTKHGKNITLNKECNTISSDSFISNTAYGNIDIINDGQCI